MTGFKMKVTPEIENLTEVCKEHSSLDLSLYQKYDVKRGLRDINGKGVLAGRRFQCYAPRRWLTARKCPVRAVFPTGDMTSRS